MKCAATDDHCSPGNTNQCIIIFSFCLGEDMAGPSPLYDSLILANAIIKAHQAILVNRYDYHNESG
jgi:hypothetical protein